MLATTLIGAGLASTTGSALPHQVGGQDGFANVDSVQTITPANACNNDVPVNALGVQVPVEDVCAVPVLSGTDGTAARLESQSCGSSVDADAN